VQGAKAGSVLTWNYKLGRVMNQHPYSSRAMDVETNGGLGDYELKN
jgi:hypothetical protein